jgi:hypothetical protein
MPIRGNGFLNVSWGPYTLLPIMGPIRHQSDVRRPGGAVRGASFHLSCITLCLFILCISIICCSINVHFLRRTPLPSAFVLNDVLSRCSDAAPNLCHISLSVIEAIMWWEESVVFVFFFFRTDSLTLRTRATHWISVFIEISNTKMSLKFFNLPNSCSCTSPFSLLTI